MTDHGVYIKSKKGQTLNSRQRRQTATDRQLTNYMMCSRDFKQDSGLFLAGIDRLDFSILYGKDTVCFRSSVAKSNRMDNAEAISTHSIKTHVLAPLKRSRSSVWIFRKKHSTQLFSFILQSITSKLHKNTYHMRSFCSACFSVSRYFVLMSLQKFHV
jgi:hypothetical protein